MKKTLVTSTTLLMSMTAYAGGNIVPEIVVNKETKNNFLNSVDGYLRLGYQQDQNRKQDIALGGKLHIETTSWNGLSVGASFYTTNSIHKYEGAGLPFFDSKQHSYSILGETYVKGRWANTSIKIGRQEIETPFAESDDIGMIPNTFEAIVLKNTDILDTTLFLAQLQRWSGIDSDTHETFNALNGNDGVQVLGISYEGLKNTTLSGWYYHIKDTVAVGYLEANYEGGNDTFSYGLGLQYSLQDYEDNTKSTIYGAIASFGLNCTGLTASIAYNNIDGRAADNFFGGGPFFTNAEHHTLSEAGKEGESILYGLEWDASSVGVDGIVLSAHFNTHTNAGYDNTKEYDIIASYDYSNNLNFTAIYSDIDDEQDAFTNLRVFANYSF